MGASSFNEMEIDAIGEIMNISLGASATAVSTMLGTAVNITTPTVNVLTRDKFEFKKLEPAVGVEIAYTEGLEGSNIMMFRRNDVRIIVGMLMGDEIPEEEFELDEINISAICEVMNQMMGSSATALSEFLGFPVNISTPVSFEIEDEVSFKEKYFEDGTKMVIVRFVLEIEGKLKSEFLNIMSTGLTKRLLAPFQLSFEEEEETQQKVVAAPEAVPSPLPEPEIKQSEPAPQVLAQPEPPMPEPQQPNQPPMPEPQQTNHPPMPELQQPTLQQQPVQQTPIQPQQQPTLQQPPVYHAGQNQPMMVQMPGDPMMIQLLSQMQQTQAQLMEMMRDMKGTERQRGTESSVIHPMNSVQLDHSLERGEEEQENQEMLMKVPLEISVEIGRTKKLVRDILEFTQGSLVVLDKMAGEQADLFVNGQCVARGDIVVVEDNFGIRITEILARDINQESL